MTVIFHDVPTLNDTLNLNRKARRTRRRSLAGFGLSGGCALAKGPPHQQTPQQTPHRPYSTRTALQRSHRKRRDIYSPASPADHPSRPCCSGGRPRCGRPRCLRATLRPTACPPPSPTGLDDRADQPSPGRRAFRRARHPSWPDNSDHQERPPAAGGACGGVPHRMGPEGCRRLPRPAYRDPCLRHPLQHAPRTSRFASFLFKQRPLFNRTKLFKVGS